MGMRRSGWWSRLRQGLVQGSRLYSLDQFWRDAIEALRVLCVVTQTALEQKQPQEQGDCLLFVTVFAWKVKVLVWMDFEWLCSFVCVICLTSQRSLMSESSFEWVLVRRREANCRKESNNVYIKLWSVIQYLAGYPSPHFQQYWHWEMSNTCNCIKFIHQSPEPSCDAMSFHISHPFKVFTVTSQLLK